MYVENKNMTFEATFHSAEPSSFFYDRERKKKVINDQVCVIKSSLLECVTTKIIQSSNTMSEFKSFSRRVCESKWLQPSIVSFPDCGDLILIQISV